VTSGYSGEGCSSRGWGWPASSARSVKETSAARPPHDLGGALCAGLIFAAGTVVIALFGARTSGRHSGPE
jgi:hypothetical protein